MYKAILVGADLKTNGLIDYYMDELKSLALAKNIEVLYTITQSINKITSNLYIGSGKVKEIKTFVDNLEANLVIFNNELSGSQIRNLETEIGVRVIDRTLLILDIFASRAKTKEAILQVEIAQLEYMLPRLSGLRDSLGRQQGGIGSRGPGEKKLELDRRKIEADRFKLINELKEIVKARKIQRKNRSRSNIRKIAIVGYTNAGKSTLLNTLIDYTHRDIDKQVYVENMLFATLETSTRHIILENKKEFIATDTVGFVSNLPHNLIESFKSTLEEITEADLLVHVVDTSNEFYEKQIDVTNKTLEEIGVHNIPIVYIYNKYDLLDEQIKPLHYPSVIVSLIEPNGIKKVLTII
ncbi:MAG: GTPase HflX, partial [Candidatus Izimaplasma sp.]|nr:GTPase HflX [Candidatus Izimaplasma bacterium]